MCTSKPTPKQSERDCNAADEWARRHGRPLRITCVFCGRSGTPDELDEHWCEGRTRFVDSL